MPAVRNKRRYLRTKASNLVAHLRVGDRNILAPIEDISLGGMLARTAESLPIGTAVMFDLARPGLKKPLRLLGVVVDTRVGRGLGIRFDGLDKEAMGRLEDLIADLGGFTHSLLVDKPEEPSPSVPSPSPSLPVTATPPPMPSPFAATNTGTFRGPAASTPVPGGATPATTSGTFRPPPGLDAEKLQQQVRSLVMELGRMQEALAQKERDLQNAIAEAQAAQGAQRLVGALEIEKRRLEDELQAVKHRQALDADAIYREAEIAATALNRLVEALRRMR
jgi:hypothetical protein